MKKKVLFVINSLGCGGAEKSLVSLLSLFDYSNYEIDLLLFRSGGFFEELLDERVHVLPLPKFNQFCNMSLKEQIKTLNLQFLFTRLRLAKALRKNKKSKNSSHEAEVYWQNCKNAFEQLDRKYDLAIGWGQGLPVKYVSNRVEAKKKAVWINADYEAVGHRREDDLVNFSKIDYIVSVSDSQNEKMKRVFPEYVDKCIAIYDVNNAELIKKMANSENVLDNYSGKKIVTVGRYNDYKGYDMAIDACKILVDKGYDIYWFAVGDGPERTNLEKQIKDRKLEDRFILLGAQSNPYKYMNAADIYVQTSRSEGFCLTLAEARILNKPCVTTNFECVYNQMIQEKNGLVVDMNAQAIAAGIERMINDDELRNSIVEYLKTEKKGNAEEIEKVYELFK